MIHIYKHGGPWETENGLKYTIKAVSRKDAKIHLLNDWVSSIEELEDNSVKQLGVDGGDAERKVRDFLKEQGQPAGPRAKMETMLSKARELGYGED